MREELSDGYVRRQAQVDTRRRDYHDDEAVACRWAAIYVVLQERGETLDSAGDHTHAYIFCTEAASESRVCERTTHIMQTARGSQPTPYPD